MCVCAVIKSVFCSVQVVNWLEGPGVEQLRAQWAIGDSIRASQALQQKHEEIESQHSVRTKPLCSSLSLPSCMMWLSAKEKSSRPDQYLLPDT